MPFGSPRAEVRAVLFGSSALVIDGRPSLGAERQWVLGVAELSRSATVLEATLDAAPPSLAEFRAWYRPLHPLVFAIDASARIPTEARLAWEHAEVLSQLEREVRGLAATFRGAARRGLCAQVLVE